MNAKNIPKKIKGGLKLVVSKIISFYYGPFETVVLVSGEPKNKNQTVIKKMPKTKVSRAGAFRQLMDYYSGKKRPLLILGILLSAVLGIGTSITYPSLLWLGAYLLVIGVYTTLYSGLYYVFQRKRDVVDGFIRFMQEYIISMDLTTFKNFVKESKEIEYPAGFRNQIIEMKQSLNTKESSVVLREFFEDPKNYYPELQIYKNLSISAISSHDPAITNALSDQIDFIKKSSTILEAKLGFLQVFIYLVLGFMFGIQTVLVYQFKSVLTSSSGVLASLNIVPASIAYFFFLVFGGLSVVLLTIGIYFGMFKEGRAIKMGLIMLYIVFAISSVLAFTQL